MKCTICNGTGKQTVTVSLFEHPELTESYKSDCIGCDGTRQINEQQSTLIDYEKNMWCTCNSSKGTRFYDDNEHPEIKKHHYRCKSCGKVVQIG